MKNTLKKLIPPRYSWGWLVAVIFVNFSVYGGARLINGNRVHYILSLPLDDRVPLCEPFIIVYLLAFAQWAAGYLLAAGESRAVCRRVAVGDIIAKMVCFAVFLIIPTTLHRPEITGSGIFDRLTRMVYSMDAPDNLLPSIHCLESWVCLRSSFWLRRVPRWYRPVNAVFTVLVCASTVLLKQHLLIDIPAGILTAELGLGLAGWITVPGSLPIWRKARRAGLRISTGDE